MRTTLRRLGISFVLAAVLVGFAAAPAAAASDAATYCEDTWSNTRDDYYPCGDAKFISEYGDGTERLVLVDGNDDGYGVAVENYRFDLSYAGPYLGVVTAGSGASTTWTLHIPEGINIEFRVCPYTHAHGLYTSLCGLWVTGTA